jgi:uncharacterized RDD family membrane protein YckC
MSIIRISTNFNIDLEFPAAPFHRRFLAWLIDVVVLFVYVYLLIKLARSYFATSPDESYIMQALFYFMLFVPVCMYHFISEVISNGQSIGKRITGLRVVNENGSRPGVGQLLMRWMIRTSEIVLLISIMLAMEAADNGQDGDLQFLKHFAAALGLLVLDVILVNMSKKRQRLGDMLAHTILIRTTQEGNLHDTIFLDVEQNYVPSFPQVMQLSDRDINALKGILDTARRREDYSMAEMASAKIQNHLKIQSSLSAFDFLEVLLKDYNYLSVH